MSIKDICQPWKLSFEMFNHSPEKLFQIHENSGKCIIVHKWANQWVYACMQEQISGKSPRFSQPLEECALSKGLLLSGHCFRRDPAASQHFPEGRNVVWHSTAKRKTPSCFTRKPVPAVPPVWCFYCSGSRGPGGRWDAPRCAFLTQCLHSANNGDKSPQVQSSEQGSTLFRERKPAIWEGCAICCHWNHTYLLPSWLHCCLEKNLCVEECNLCTLCVRVCVCVCWSFICNVVGVGNRIWGAGWVGLQDVSRRS